MSQLWIQPSNLDDAKLKKADIARSGSMLCIASTTRYEQATNDWSKKNRRKLYEDLKWSSLKLWAILNQILHCNSVRNPATDATVQAKAASVQMDGRPVLRLPQYMMAVLINT